MCNAETSMYTTRHEATEVYSAGCVIGFFFARQEKVVKVLNRFFIFPFPFPPLTV